MRLIDADVLAEKMRSEIYRYWNEDGGGYYLAEDAVVEVENAPTVDAEPVLHGKWIEKEKDGFLHCSNCGYVRIGIPIMFNFEYCPKCGAKMDGE